MLIVIEKSLLVCQWKWLTHMHTSCSLRVKFCFWQHPH
jgi:hypothetical protein